jgi:Gram-negative bacterial TonB protein C-terminal
MHRLVHLLCLASVLTACAVSAQQSPIPLGTAAENAVKQSQLTLPGSKPFHLKAAIVESTNPDSGYKAEVEEDWVSPDKWRRVIRSPAFSQLRVVNGANVFEQNTGDYFPWWLQNLVTAIFDPLPMLAQLKSSDTKLFFSGGAQQASACNRMSMKVGDAPAQNSLFFVFCFSGKQHLLDSVVTPGYEVEFKQYLPFEEKFVARLIASDPEPGTTVQAKVTELKPLSSYDEKLFAIEQPTPPNEQILSIRIDNAVLKRLALSTAEVQWPGVRDGKTTGVLSLYISVDRTGKVREVWPLNSDNPQLDGAAREQVGQWQYKQAVVKGAPVQFEGIVTLPFATQISNPIPVLTDAESRKLATKIVEASFKAGTAPSGTAATVRVSVSEEGKILGVSNPGKLNNELFFPAMVAVRQWTFRPYEVNGKASRFDAEITFRAR